MPELKSSQWRDMPGAAAHHRRQDLSPSVMIRVTARVVAVIAGVRVALSTSIGAVAPRL